MLRVLDGLNLEIGGSQIITLLGQSGCGKSTLLRAIAGLQELSHGSVLLNGDPATQSREAIGFVFQEAALLDWRTVWDNVRLPLEFHRDALSDTQASNEIVLGLLKAVSLPEDSFTKFPDQLSGGMKMRVAIARSLVRNPKYLLLDEPFAALDDILRNQLNLLLVNLWQERQATVVFVTHNISEAIFISHQIAIMHGGKICEMIDIPAPLPRDGSFRSSPEFAQLYGQVSQALERLSRTS